LRSRRVRLKTPEPSTPHRCIATIRTIVASISHDVPVDPSAPIGVGVPGVAMHGVVRTAANIHGDWLGFDAGRAVREALGRPARMVNDADAAGVAEMRFGAGRGQRGTVLIVTLGTGVGTALFRDGHLVPNTELGHIEIRGRDAEDRASAAARIRRKQSWEKWASDVDEYLHRIDALVWPDLVIVGGGVSKEAAKFLPRLTVRPPVVAAQLRNEAGIVGAAVIGVEAADLGIAAGVAAGTGPGAAARGDEAAGAGARGKDGGGTA
jgi:polyphosphate glucokinase